MTFTVKKLLLMGLIFIFSTFILWKIIFFAYGSILSFSFWLDDWPLLWGVMQQSSPVFNPSKAFWNFEDERFTVREGHLQIWATAIIYYFYKLDPYYFHMFGLIAKLITSLSLIWAGWKLSSNLFIGLIAGFAFASFAIGSESLYWYNVNGVYLLAALTLVALPFFIEGIAQNKSRYFTLSLIISAFAIFLYPPRAYVFLSLPILALIWSGNPFSKKLWIKIVIILLIIFIAYKLPAGGGAEGQAYRAIIHRLIVFSGDGLNSGNHIFFTYPLAVIPLATFPLSFLQDLISLPQKLFFGIVPRPLASFYVWNFIFFPLLWFVSISGLLSVRENLAKAIKNKKFIIWFCIGPVWAVLNEFIRKIFFEGRFWDYPTQFLFTFAIFLVLFSTASFFLLRQTAGSRFSRLLITFLILIIISYIFNWAFDPLIHPASPSISRYLTLPSVFGALFLATGLGMVILFIWHRIYSRVFFKSLAIVLFVLIGFVFFKSLKSDLEIGKDTVERILLPVRAHTKVSSILNTISDSIRSGDKPAIILLDSWNYSEVFAILLYSGHQLAVWNNIKNPNDFPRIYYDEKKLLEEFPTLCKRFKITPKNLYRFKVDVDKATNISDQFPKLSCDSIAKAP